MNTDWILPLLDWYEKNARPLPWRNTCDPYRILVSEVMLQQTRVTAVIPYYQRFLCELPTLHALAEVPEEHLMKLWEGLGYYSRARNLKKAAMACMDRYDGALPADYDALRTLPGLGPYTAGAVASIAFGVPVPAVDGNVLRVLTRLNDDDADVAKEQVKEEQRRKLVSCIPKDRPGAFNQALMELGAVCCVPNGPPNCERCPVRAHCKARAAGREQLLPVKSGKKPRRTEEKTVFALTAGGRLIGRKRPDTGLLAGLYQLLETPGKLTPDEAAKALFGWGLRPIGALSVYERRHIFTHVEWHMRVYSAEVAGALPEGAILLSEREALPKAYRVCILATSATTTQRSGAGPTNVKG